MLAEALGALSLNEQDVIAFGSLQGGLFLNLRLRLGTSKDDALLVQTHIPGPWILFVSRYLLFVLDELGELISQIRLHLNLNTHLFQT